VRLAAVLGAGGVLAGLVCAPLAAQKAAKSALAPGDTAPAFTLMEMNGDAVNLADYAGHPILLDFWASWCPSCRDETPLIVAAWAAHHDSGFVVLAVNLRDWQNSMRAVRKFVTEFAMPFPVLVDEKGKVRKRYAVVEVPTLVFIGASGVVSAVEAGPVPAPVFQRDLEVILSLP
jgi:cytochrome c biogenesis protein CcmG/thiol:disulfide interchange protein DsbE